MSRRFIKRKRSKKKRFRRKTSTRRMMWMNKREQKLQ